MNRHVKNPRRAYTPPPLQREPDEARREHVVETIATVIVIFTVAALVAVLVALLNHWDTPW